MSPDIVRCRAEQASARDWLAANPEHPDRAGAILGAQDWLAEEIMIEEEMKRRAKKDTEVYPQVGAARIP